MAVSALYTPVEENDGIHKGSREGDSFDFLLQEVAQPQNSPRNRVPRRKVVWIIHLLLLMTSCSILLLALKHERDGKYDCVKRQSFYCSYIS